MSLPPAHSISTPGATNGNDSTRTRAGSLAQVNADSLAENPIPKPIESSQSSGAAKVTALPTHTRKSSGAAADLDPYSASHIYYGASHGKRNVAKARTYSAVSVAHV